MIKFNAIKAATIAANNESEEGRVYNISAEIETRDGKATNVSRGSVKKVEGEEEIATFNGWNESHLTVNMNNVSDEEQDAVFAAVRAFVKQLREKAGNLNLTEACI